MEDYDEEEDEMKVWKTNLMDDQMQKVNRF
jgi:hypothetical protein